MAHGEAEDLRAEVADRARAERATVTLAERLRSQHDSPIEVLLRDGSTASGVIGDAAAQWLMLEPTDTTGELLVPIQAVAGFRGLSRRAGGEPSVVERRLGLGNALRAIARDRAAVEIATTGGRFTGTVDRVGADHLDLAEHARDALRRSRDVRGVVVVQFAALVWIRRLAHVERWT